MNQDIHSESKEKIFKQKKTVQQLIPSYLIYRWNLFSFQFVPFRDFLGRYGGQNHSIAQAALAKEVLAEIPDQVVSYMKMNSLKPRPASTAPPPSLYTMI